MGGAIAGGSRALVEADLHRVEQLQQLQSQSRVPVLRSSQDPNSYIFVVMMDGTMQDMHDPSQQLTNVGHMARQLGAKSQDPALRVGYAYVAGIGTGRDPLSNAVDAAIPYTWDDRLEEAYRGLAAQVSEWRKQNPDAHVGVILSGYSRGGVLDAGLARIIDTYGIAEYRDLAFGRDAQGNVSVVSPHLPLVPPGQTPMVFGLYDPVATNMPKGYDARLPSGAMAGVAVSAADEARTGFPHQTIIATGVTRDGRFVSGAVPGGHADVGGGNEASGLQAMNFNIVADTLNATSDVPLFKLRELPRHIDDYRITQAGGPTAGYGLAMDRDGRRNLREELANCKVVDPCREAEPVNADLAARLEWREVVTTWRVPKIEELERANQPARPETTRGATQRGPGTGRDAGDGRVTPSAESPQARAEQQLDPSDRRLLDGIRQSMRTLDLSHGRAYDDASERAAWALLPLAKARGMTEPDHAVVSIAGPNTTAGQHLFLVQGALDDPGKLRVHMDTVQAMQTPIETSFARVQDVFQQQSLAESQRLQSMDQERAQALRMQM